MGSLPKPRGSTFHSSAVPQVIAVILLLIIACRLPGNLTPGSILPENNTATPQTPTSTAALTGNPTPEQKAAPTEKAGPSANLPPAIVKTQPLPGSQIGVQEKITMGFNIPMNRDSVEKSIQVSIGNQGIVQWIDDQTLTIAPASPLPADTSFTIDFEPSAQSSSGIAMLAPAEFTYHTGPALRVTQFLPADNSQDITPGAAVSVSFNQPVVPLSTDNGTNPEALQIEPSVPGTGKWLNTSTYIFTPNPPLPGGTQYTVQVNPKLTSLDGLPLATDPGKPARWSFRTSMPAVQSFSPGTKAPIRLDQEFVVKFNQPMDSASVEAGLQLLGSDGNPVPVKREWNERKDEVTLSPASLLARGASYTLSIDPATKASGGTPLGTALKNLYSTVNSLEIASSEPAAGQPIAVGSGDFGGFTLHFNAPLAKEAIDPTQSDKGPLPLERTIKNFFQVTPAVADLYVYLDTDHTKVILSGFFQPSTTYQVQVSGGLTDLWGGKIAAPINLTVPTSPARPDLRIPALTTGPSSIFFTPDDVQVSVDTTNLFELKLTSGKITLADFINLSNDLSATNVQPTSVNNWTLPLNKLPQNQSNALQVQLSPYGANQDPGLYYFTIRSDQLGKEQPSPFMGVVSRVNLLVKRSAGEVFVWAVDMLTRQPLEGKSISLFSDQNVSIGLGTTDKDGIARIALPASFGQDSQVFAVSGLPGAADFALGSESWNTGISGWNYGISTMLLPSQPKAYLYTDRPIYRPGQTVYYRAVVRQANNGRYAPVDLSRVTLKVLGNYSNDSGDRQLLNSADLPLSAYGTVTGSYILPQDAVPGSYEISIQDIPGADVPFQVAEYRKPQIDLQVQFPQEEMLVSADLDASIQASYFFGAPASGQSISWSLVTAPEDPYIPGGYQAGLSGVEWLNDPASMVFQSLVTQGEGVTGPDGSLAIHLSAKDLAGKIDVRRAQRLTLEATITSPDQSTVSARSTILLHPTDFSIGLRADTWDGTSGVESGFSVLTIDQKAAPAGGKQLEAQMDQVSWEVTPGPTSSFSVGTQRTAHFTPISSASLATDAQGRARIAFTPPAPGVYRVEVSGQGATTQIVFWVNGAGSAQWPSLPDQHLQLVADVAEYKAGQQAKVLIPNPFPAGARALVTIERAKVMRAQVLELKEPSLDLPIDLSAEDAPNVYVSVTLLGTNSAGKPDFRQGYLNLKVMPEAELLQVDVTPQPSSSYPGGKIDLNIRVRDANGAPVQGEFSLSLVDKALLALTSPNADPISDAFYSDQPLGVITSTPMAIYSRRIDTTLPGGRGGGGSEGATELRAKFADTAFWNGSIETNTEGMATISVTLPDNLTTWVATVRGLTKDTLVGEATCEVIAVKDLMVQPITPRFLVAGDRVELAAVVFNHTHQALDVDVALSSTGAALDLSAGNPAQQKVKIPAGGNQRVSWQADIQQVSSVHLVFSAQSGTLQDSATPESGDLPVLRYVSPAVVGTSGLLTEAGDRKEVIAAPSKDAVIDSLTLELSPSLASSILSGLESLDNFQGDDPEAVLSRFLPNLVTYRTLVDLGLDQPTLKSRLDQTMQDSIRRLVRTQNSDGGWSWTAGQASDTYISSYVFFGLSQAAKAGVQVDQKNLEKARDFLVVNLQPVEKVKEDWQLDRMVFQVYVLGDSGMVKLDKSAIYDQRDRLSPWSKALLALYIRNLFPDDARAKNLITDLAASAKQSSTGAHWENDASTPMNLTTANFNTALVMYAMAQIDPAQPILTDGIRYLVLSRQSTGGWASSYESAWVLLALDAAMKGTGDLQASYTFSASINNQQIAQGTAGGVNSLTSVNVNVPQDALQSPGGSLLTIQRGEGSGRLNYRAFLKVYQPVENAQPVDRGLVLARTYLPSGQDCQKTSCVALQSASLSKDKTITVRLSLTLAQDVYSLVVDDFIPAGAEIIDPGLSTSRQVDAGSNSPFDPFDPYQNGWGWWLFGSPQIYDDHIRWTASYLPAGAYELTYRLNLLQAGEFRVLPAQAYERYFPDVSGASGGEIFTITGPENPAP
jgi:alpha-2-macroglobulin